MSLEAKLEMGILNSFRKHFGIEKKPEQIDLNRRQLLKKMGVGGVTIGASLLAPGMISKALGYYLNKLPPGIRIVKDEKLRFAFEEIYFNSNNKLALGMLLREADLNDGNVKPDTPLKEPAYWFTVEMVKWHLRKDENFIGRNFINELKRIRGTNMRNWYEGIDAYFNFRNSNINQEKNFEISREYLAKCFVRACTGATDINYKILTNNIEEEQFDEKTIDNYFKNELSSYNNNSPLLKIIQQLNNKKFENKVLASWSLFILGELYFKAYQDISKVAYIVENIEKPLQRNCGMPKIRGPPWYFP